MKRRPRFGGEEPRPPVFVSEADRFLQERRLLEGKVDLEQSRSRERGFREQKISAASSAANAEIVRADVKVRDGPSNRLRGYRLLVRGKARLLAAGSVDHVAAEQDHFAGGPGNR